MSDETTTTTTAQPAAPAAPPPAADPLPQLVAATQPVPDARQTQPTKPDGDPAWLGERLERERRKLLADLGVENVDNAKKALADYKARVEAEKTEAQRTAERLVELDQRAKRAEALEAQLQGYAARELASLSEAQRSAVAAVAGDDPAKILGVIDSLRPTWAAPTTAPVPAPKPDPVTTAPAPNAPDGATTTQPSRLAEYVELRKTNPFAAAQFHLRHYDEISKERQSQA